MVSGGGNADELERVFERDHRRLDEAETLVGELGIVGIVDLRGVIIAVEHLDERDDILGHLVRLAVERVGGDLLRELADHLEQLQLLLVGQTVIGIDRLELGDLGILEDRAHARVGILGVVHGVVVVLGAGELEIEIHVRRNVLGDEEPTRGVYTDILAQLADGDRVAGALGHFDFLAVFDHADHLDEVDRERALRIAERGEGRSAYG